MWKLCGILLRQKFWVSLSDNNPLAHFLLVSKFGLSSQITNFLQAAVGVVFYIIWFACNQKMHCNIFLPVARSFVFKCSAIVKANLVQSGVMHNSVMILLFWDRWVWRCVLLSPMDYSCLLGSSFIGWLKVNSDEADLGAPGLAGGRGIFVIVMVIFRFIFCNIFA